MKVDVFTHVQPRRFLDRLLDASPALAEEIGLVYGVKALYDMSERFRVMDRFGSGYRQVLTLSGPPLDSLDPKTAVELARLANEEMAALVDAHPERFEGFVASLPMNTASSPALADAPMKAAEHAVTQLGALGVQLHTQVAGRAVTEPATIGVFDTMALLNKPIWLHPERGPSHPDYPGHERSDFEIWFSLGWPHETSVAMAHIVFSGVMDRHPGLKIIAHQMGGTIPYLEGRIANVWERLGARTPDRPYRELRESMKARPVDCFRRFHADTVGAVDPAALDCCRRFFGDEHLLFGTDMPFGPNQGEGYFRGVAAAIEGLPVDTGTRERIYEHNARALLGS